MRCAPPGEMQERLERLNAELEQRFGSKIALRIGLNTGEVVAGDATLRQALVTGDAVNVAARLEQAASPGEILIGEATFRLVRNAVSAEPVAPLELKGKSEPLPAYRLTHVEAEAPARVRRLDMPMVGRDGELALLRDKLAEAAAGHCILATVVGEPGVGKSRLAAELVSHAQDEFRILAGRCLPYGEGITYWPIAEIVRQAAGIRDEQTRDEALARIGAILAEDDAHVVAQAIGLVEGNASTDEIAGALRGLIRALAGRQPLLLFVDDIHWAEDGASWIFSPASRRRWSTRPCSSSVSPAASSSRNTRSGTRRFGWSRSTSSPRTRSSRSCSAARQRSPRGSRRAWQTPRPATRSLSRSSSEC